MWGGCLFHLCIGRLSGHAMGLPLCLPCECFVHPPGQPHPVADPGGGTNPAMVSKSFHHRVWSMDGDLAPSLGGRKNISRTKFLNDLF